MSIHSNKRKHSAGEIQKPASIINPEWDDVIYAALTQLQELEAQAARLRVSIDYFEKRRDSGAAFPGSKRLRSAGLHNGQEESK